MIQLRNVFIGVLLSYSTSPLLFMSWCVKVKLKECVLCSMASRILAICHGQTKQHKHVLQNHL